MITFVAIAFVLMAFAVFAIGFLIGYKKEDKKIWLKERQNEIKESDKEKKAKKDWKNFLNYDGSSPIDFNNVN